MGYDAGECVFCACNMTGKMRNVCKPCLKTSPLWNNSRFRHEISHYGTNLSGPSKDCCDYCQQPDTAVYKAALCQMHCKQHSLQAHFERHIGRKISVADDDDNSDYQNLLDFVDCLKLLLNRTAIQIDSSEGCWCGGCDNTLKELCLVDGFTEDDLREDRDDIKKVMHNWLDVMGFTSDRKSTSLSDDKRYFFPEKSTGSLFWSLKCPKTIKSIVAIEYESYDPNHEYHEWDALFETDSDDESDDDGSTSNNFWLSKNFSDKGEIKVICHTIRMTWTVSDIYQRWKSINKTDGFHKVDYAIVGDVLVFYLQLTT